MWKMSAKKNKIKTVSDKITEKFLPKPLADPENDPESLVKIADFDEEDDYFALSSKPSDIRKRNVKLLSEFSSKYKGKVTSRKELEEESENSGSQTSDLDEFEDASDSVDSELEKYKSKLKENTVDTDEEIDEDEDDQSDNDGSQEDSLESPQKNGKGNASLEFSDDDYSESQDEEDEDDETEQTEESEEDSDYASTTEDIQLDENDQTNILAESNQNTEVQKGLAVQNQLKIWEKLLEIRIHSQKISTKANSLPPPKTFIDFCNRDEDFKKVAKETVANVEHLLENMLDIQRSLASQYSEMKEIFKENRKRPSAADKLMEEPSIKRFASVLNSNHESFSRYRNSVLLKWDDRMKILTPGASKRGRNSMNNDSDVIQKIDAVLLRKTDLLAKSQTVKENYQLFGCRESETEKENNQNEDEKKITSTEIYDDNDFYHQQLRELIEYKSNTSVNPLELSKQFAELQKLRQKMKKKVDTRASKGRKIRYVVHNKLVNFMAPNENSTWTDESKTELYRSLFAT